MKSLFKYLAVFTFSLALFLFISWLGSFDFALKASIAVILIPLLVLGVAESSWTYSLKYGSPIVVSVQVLPLAFLHLVSFEQTRAALPASLIIMIISVLSLQLKLKTKALVYLLPTSALVYLLLSFFFYPLWIQRINFQSWTATVEQGEPVTGAFVDEYGRPIELPLIGKEVVIEFWFSTCANCYAEMPAFENLRATFEKDDLQFISIRKPIQYDHKARQPIEFVERNYGSNAWMAVDSTWTDQNGFNVFPSYAVLNEQGQLTHYGTLERISSVLQHETEFKK